MTEEILSPILIGCLAQPPGGAMHLLALLGFVFAARSLSPTPAPARSATSARSA